VAVSAGRRLGWSSAIARFIACGFARADAIAETLAAVR
jgi:hypothetical protein